MKPDIKFIFEEKEVTDIDIGVVPVNERKVLRIKVRNDGDAGVQEIEWSCRRSDIKIVSAPESIDAGKEGVIVIEYNPSEDSERGIMDSLKMDGFYLT